MPTEAQINQVYQLFVGYFGRPPTQAAVDYYAGLIADNPDQGYLAMLDDAVNSPEAAALFEDASTQDVVFAVFNNAFGRDPLEAGLDFYTGLIDDEVIPVTQLPFEIIANPDAVDPADQAVLDAKIAVAQAVTAALGDDAEAIADYQDNLDQARALLASVVDEESRDFVLDNLDAILANLLAGNAWDDGLDPVEPPVDGETFTLTVGTDTLEGTDGDDVFNAPLVFVQDGSGRSEFQTLNEGDILDGGAGFDRLNAVLNGTSTSDNAGSGTTRPELITNIEQFFIRARSDWQWFDMVNVEGAEQVWNDRSTQDLYVDNVQNSVVMGLNQVRGDTTFALRYGGEGEGIDSQTIVAQGAGTANSPVWLGIDVSDDDITELDIIAESGVNNLSLERGFDAVENLTITGSAVLMLDGEYSTTFANIQTVDATEYSGDLTLDISGQDGGANDEDGLQSVVLGDGDNRLVIDAAVLNADDFDEDDDDLLVLNLGGGSNTLALAGNAADWATEDEGVFVASFEAADVSGAQTLELGLNLNYSASDVTFDLEGLDELETIVHTSVLNLGEVTVVNSPEVLTAVYEQDAYFNVLNIDELEEANFFVTDAEAEVDVEFEIGELNAEELVTASLTLDGEVFAFLDELNADNLESLTINLGEEGVLSGPQGGTTESLESVTLTGGDKSGFLLFFGEPTPKLSTLDLSDFAGKYDEDEDFFENGEGFEIAGGVAIDGSERDGTLTILIGEGDLGFELVGSKREIFEFVGDDVGTVVIEGFEAGSGGNRDRLDLTEFGITAATAEDLVDVDYDDEGAILTSDLFEGSITLLGLDAESNQEIFASFLS